MTPAEAAKQAQKPVIRFVGFTDAWEQRKFCDCATIQRGGSPRPIDNYITHDPGGVNWIKIGDVSTDAKYIYKTEDRIIPEGAAKSRWVYPGDLILSNSMSFGRPYICKISGCIHDGWLLIRDEKSLFDKEFLVQLLSSDSMLSQYKALAAGSTVNNLNKDLVSSTTVCYPKKEEQRVIGAFLGIVDSSIVLHQRKLEHLSSLKKALLQKMFPVEGEDKPLIRFSNFTDAWEQRKLFDLTERVTRRNQNLESELPLTISAQNGLIDQNDFFDKRIASKNLENYYLLYKGEFAYNKSTSNEAPWGAIKRLDKYDKGVVSSLYIAFGIRFGRIDSNFLVSYFDTSFWFKEIKGIASEGARNHGLLNVAPKSFFDIQISIPKTLKEQWKIGFIFGSLESTIVLHQRKLEELQKLKKSLLQKMFI